MKKFKIILFVVVILVGCGFHASAQKRRHKPENTASARAIYGTPPGAPKLKSKNTVKKGKSKAGYTTSKKARGKREGKYGRRPRAIL